MVRLVSGVSIPEDAVCTCPWTFQPVIHETYTPPLTVRKRRQTSSRHQHLSDPLATRGNPLCRFIHSMKTHEEYEAMDSITKQKVCDHCGRAFYALGVHKKYCNYKKQCTNCKQTKAPTEFYKDCKNRDGLRNHCKVCCMAADKKRKKNKPDYSKMKQCTNCKQTKAPTEFTKACSNRDGLRNHCKVCCMAADKKREKKNLEKHKARECEDDKVAGKRGGSLVIAAADHLDSCSDTSKSRKKRPRVDHPQLISHKRFLFQDNPPGKKGVLFSFSF